MKKSLFLFSTALILSTSALFSTPVHPPAIRPIAVESLQQERAVPAHSYIYISSKYALEMIEIFDDQGNLYEKIPLQATTYYALDIRKWPLGVYTVKVTNNISTLKRKILKVR